MSRPLCRICRGEIPYGEATSARKVHSHWRHGFVHRSCYVVDLEAKKAARRLTQERRWENAGQGKLFP